MLTLLPISLGLAGLVVPLLAASIFISSYMFMKGVTFGVGFAFFGDPIIQRGLNLLNTKFPNWQKLLEVRNTILKGVPTNAQLTLTLLRVGEVNKAPLPPPPIPGEVPPEEPVMVSTEELKENLGVDEDELQDAIAPEPGVAHEVDGKNPLGITLSPKPHMIRTSSKCRCLIARGHRRS
jgi:hypothetical protein